MEKNANGGTPLHYAAEYGKLVEFKLIIDNVEDKNPMNKFGLTPLHFAARMGQLIINNVEDKNPIDAK